MRRSINRYDCVTDRVARLILLPGPTSGSAMKVARRLLLAAVVVVCRPAETQILSADLDKACNDKTKVFKVVDGKTQMVGEHLDGLCRGYLEASFDAFQVGQERVVCVVGSRPSSEYLASVFQIYLGTTPESRSEPAWRIVRVSFGNAFRCKDNEVVPVGPTLLREKEKHELEKTRSR
jgi:hypothetical protein